MLQNYFTIAWRSLWKNKVYSLINIFGLSIGIAFTLLVGAYVWGELQVNHNLRDAENQYIIQSKWKVPNMGYELTTIAPLAKTLKETYPTLVANYYHWDGVGSIVSKGDKHFRESIQIGDSTLFSMYGFGLLHGDTKKALNDPFSAVITQRLALKYFGKTDVVGQTLTIESFRGEKHGFTISGVLDKLPKNSVTDINDDNKNDFFLPAKAADFLGRNMDGWSNIVLVSYIELKKGVTPQDLVKPMQHLIKENAPRQISDNLTPYLVPLKTYYVDDNVKKMLYTVSFIALFILLMAVINFVNICIGSSSARMKEMGIRKVLGGLRKHLVWQFLVESTLLVMLATVISLIIYMVARPYFSDILGKEITGLFSFPLYFLFIPFLFALFVGMLAGIYPALVLSALKSVDSLKGKLSSVKQSVLFRKALVVFQFGAAAVVLICAIVISQQVSLFFNGDLGFKKDYVVYAQVPRDWSDKGVKKMEAIRNQIAQMPEVSSVSLSWEIPDGGAYGGNFQVYRQGTDPKQAISVHGLATDNQYALTYNIPLKAGTFFTSEYTPADSGKVVINETASKALGWKDPQDAIGQLINSPGSTAPATICGVTADFHFGSMQWKIDPISFTNVNYSHYYRFFSFKLKPGGDMQKSIASLQKQWNVLLPGAPFEYHFMDEALAKLYANEIQLRKAAFMATVLACIIVLLGVLGLISLSVQKRTKEIGIRKVLGSSVQGIIALFIKEFLGVVAIAVIIACPLAWLMMHSWLNGYTYRITITSYPFILSIVTLTLVTVFLITIQTIKAALSNPVKSLRTE